MKKKKLSRLLPAVLAAVAMTAMAALRPVAQAEAVTSAFVLPRHSNIYDTVTLRGQVIEEGRQGVYPPDPCRVVESYVRLRQSVEAGQALLLLETVGSTGDLSSTLSRELERAAEGLPMDSGSSLEAGRALLAGALAAGLADDEESHTPGRRFTLHSPTEGIVMTAAAASGWPPDSVAGKSRFRHRPWYSVWHAVRCAVWSLAAHPHCAPPDLTPLRRFGAVERCSTSLFWHRFLQTAEAVKIFEKPGVEYNKGNLERFVYGTARNAIYTELELVGKDAFFERIYDTPGVLNENYRKLLNEHRREKEQ